ncbi:MAG: hypothetical protein RMK18_04335 [Armatimonadota bacterium]|nr:YfhO family protein [Armatimonadota bacterium]MCX7777408.1 YfhO family protein [Armatimonadota bacterium]MDW8025077.1 hypothetical protein [Armatimonadota bacterium]
MDSKKTSIRHADLIAVVLLVVLSVLFHWRYIIGGKVMLPEALTVLCGVPAELSKTVRWDALQWDSAAQYLPWRHVAEKMLRQNTIPLWNAHQGCGMPLLANPQVGVFYPLNLLFWLLKDEVAINWSAFLHTVIAVLSAYWLARVIGLSPVASVASSISYAFSAPLITWQMLPPAFNTMCWLPFAIACIALYLQQPSPFKLTCISIACVMLILSGHPQICIYSFIAMAVTSLLICAVLSERVGVGSLMMHLLLIILSITLAIFISAVQLLTTLELAMYSHRSGKPTWDSYLWFSSRGMRVEDFVMLILPYAWGMPQLDSYIGKENFADYCPYVGVIAILFAVIASLPTRNGVNKSKRYSIAVVMGACLAIVGFLLATGSPFNIPFYFILPGFAQIGTPTRAWFMSALGLAMLCGVGIDRLLEQNNRVPSFLVALFVACAVGLLMAVAAYRAQLCGTGFGSEAMQLVHLNLGVVFALCVVGLVSLFLSCFPQVKRLTHAIVAPIIVELLLFGYGYNQALSRQEARSLLDVTLKAIHGSMSYDTADSFRVLPVSVRWRLRAIPGQPNYARGIGDPKVYDEWLRRHKLPDALLPPNLISLVGLSDPQAYDSLMLRSYKALMEAVEGAHPCPPENGNMVLLRNVKSSLLRHISVRYIIVREPSQATGARCKMLKQIGNMWLCEIEGSLERAWVPKRIVKCVDGEKALAVLKRLSCSDEMRTGALAVVTCRDDSSKLLADGWLKCSIYSDEGVAVRIDCYGVGGVVLVLNDTFYPGWRAWLSFRKKQLELPVLTAQYALRCVPIPKFTEPMQLEIKFAYLPTSYLIGSFVSASSFSALIGLLFFALLRKRSIRH